MSQPANDRWGDSLPRKLGLLSAIAVVAGSTIGSGIFRNPAVIASRIDTLPLFALGWLLGGVIALAGALAFAELAATFPRTGGVYIYIREGFGRAPAFLFGWAELILIRPAALGAVSIVSAEYFWRLMGRDGALPFLGPLSYAQATAIVFIILIGAVNYRGVQLGALIQNTSAALKIGALAILVLLGLVLSPRPDATLPAVAEPLVRGGWATASAFGLAMISILWAYDGFADLGFVGGEVKNPERNLASAIIVGTIVVVVVYLLVNVVYLKLVGLPRMPNSTLVAADAAQAVMGTVGRTFVSAAVMISTFGTLNGSTMTGPRVFFAMAEDRVFFRKLAEVHPKYGTPATAIVLAAALGVFFVSYKDFANLADQFIIGIWPFYALAVAALFILRRKRPDLERPYRTFGYPLTPALFLLAALFLLGNYAVSDFKTFRWNVLVILAGLPIYWAWGWYQKRSGSKGLD